MSNKFKIGDKVIIYGKVKGTITCLPKPFIDKYQVAYKVDLPGPKYGLYPENALELVEIWESPLYQALMEE